MQKRQTRSTSGFVVFCAQNRNRTCTPFRKQDFESSASTSSAIWAKQLSFSCGLQMYKIFQYLQEKFKLLRFRKSPIYLHH